MSALPAITDVDLEVVCTTRIRGRFEETMIAERV